jgi:hypothetical protein
MSNEADEKAAAVAELKRQMSEVRALRQSVSVDELENAITRIAAFLQTSSDTGGGRRLQQFVWSLWNTDHLINLYDLASYPIAPLTEAVITMFRAAMVGVLTEDQKRRLLTDSGELARWEHVCAQTPEDEEVLYPLPPASAEFLITLGVSAQRSKKRADDERRSA